MTGQIDAQYGVAIKALHDAMKERLGIAADAYITRFWKKQHEDDTSIPDWEKSFDQKYADMFELIIGTANAYGLDGHTYIAEFFTACDVHGEGVPCTLQNFLPWNMTSRELDRYKKPTPIQVGDKVFPSSAALTAWASE